jgi:tight adherence protein C
MLIIVPAISWFLLNRKIQKRQDAFADQLPDLLQTLSSSLRSGQSLPQSIAAMAPDMSAPAGDELRRVVIENRIGRDLIESFKALAARMDSLDFDWVVRAIEINHHTGGDLSVILRRLDPTIRARNQVAGVVRSLTAEGRISGIVLSTLPPGLMLAVQFLNPDFMEPMFTTGTGSSNLHEVLLARSRSERVVQPWLKKANAIITGATPKSRIAKLREMAVTGGISSTWTPQRIATARTISLASGVTFGLLAWRGVSGNKGILLGAIIVLLGWRGVDTYLTNRARARQEAIQSELPDIADQIAITVQAGLGFEQAISRTVDSTEGPLSDELGRFLHDVRIGMTRGHAFKSLQERSDVPDMTSFVRAIAQAEKTGVSIADVLQIQADERAMKLPAPMLLPLVTCILPPLLMVLLGPAILQVMETGFGAGGI